MVREEIAPPLPPVEYVMTIPTGTERMGIGILRPRRVDGPTAADRAFQRSLFMVIGGITVAAGHVEMAMKQLIVKLTASDFDLGPVGGDMWQQLEEKLLKLCDGSTTQLRELKSVIEQSKGNKLRERRNDVIHGYWWTYDIGSVRNVRHGRGGKDFVMRGALTEVADLGDALFKFANKLEKLCGDDWPYAILARGGVRPSDNPDDPFPIQHFAQEIARSSGHDSTGAGV